MSPSRSISKRPEVTFCAGRGLSRKIPHAIQAPCKGKLAERVGFEPPIEQDIKDIRARVAQQRMPFPYLRIWMDCGWTVPSRECGASRSTQVRSSRFPHTWGEGTAGIRCARTMNLLGAGPTK